MVEIKKYDFQKLAERGKLSGFDMKENSKKAREWFRQEAKKVSYMQPKSLQQAATAFQNIQNLSINSIGKLYFFSYDPKWKEQLPYYDIYPLVFPFTMYPDRMLGINVHYLSPVMRARLMNALYTTLNNEKYNKTTRLQISYEILKGSSRFKYFKPTIHTYLFSHVQSPFQYIPPLQWDTVCFLPLARFQKAPVSKVYLDSSLKVN